MQRFGKVKPPDVLNFNAIMIVDQYIGKNATKVMKFVKMINVL